MKTNINEWKKFKIKDIFEKIKIKKYSSDPETVGDIPFITSSSVNNGIRKFVELDDEVDTIEDCITVSTNGSCLDCFYQEKPCYISTDVEVLKNVKLNKYIYLFLITLLKKEKFKWGYGRKPKNGKIFNIEILLPAKINLKNKYEPDWEFMENYIIGLNSKPLKTKNNKNNIALQTKEWKEFYLHKLFHTRMGNGIDSILTDSSEPKYNYVSRDSNGNGVVDFVDEIVGEEVFPEGAMSLALGGSFLGSCFVQKKPFYTAQNVGILQEKVPISIYSKLFISTLIRNECKIKFQAFGRELNSHFSKDFKIKLPIMMNNNKVVFDNEKTFSDEGYIPDWEFMDNFIKSLPYGDRI